MAVAYDNSTASSWASSSRSSHTFAHTVTGSDPVLLVGLGTFNSTGGSKTSGVTYGGVAMTFVATLEIQGNTFIDLYKLVNPATGSNNVVLTFSSAQSFGWINATSYTGAGDPNVSVTKKSTGSSPTTVTLTTLTDNSWLAMYAFDNSSNNAAGAGTTERTDSGRGAAMDSNSAKSPAGSYSLAFSHNSPASAGAIMVAIPESGGGPPAASQNSNFLKFM